ncbi:MAG: acetyl-CoA acetyltransferase, partial [Rhodopila sp.]|nr:acetyl-CoA acetyltransferase [Rhodopila sp.]
MSVGSDRIPVIIGIGEIKDRPADPSAGLEPMALMAEAARRAEADAGVKVLDRLDAI